MPEGQVGRVEQKLLQLGEVRGIVTGAWGEVSEPTHALLAHLANSRVRIALPTRSRRGLLRSEDAERALAISSLRRRLGVATVKAQSLSLLGRLECLGIGGAAAAGRRLQAQLQERNWRRQDQAYALALRTGKAGYQIGFSVTN